ncbi:MAG: serine/threonine protein phosphatase [Deltaproteobacteria bacterium]|nr:serine/threonine protein phosphatase [Deltaproteobacteria bacterium]
MSDRALPATRTLVVGDVHGCAEELDALVRLVRPARVVLLGDLFTRGPDPLGVWALVQEHRMACLLGNHERRLLKPREGDAVGRALARRLDREIPAWRPWAKALPLFRDEGRFLLVHGGLHPSGDLALTPRKVAIGVRRWPPGDEHAPFWHDLYRGGRAVVFGHDAVGGLVWRQREGRPHVIGLDSGCVYGGALTGLIVEEECLVQVAARRQWFDPWSQD